MVHPLVPSGPERTIPMTVSPFEATSSIEEPRPNLPLLRKVLDHIDAHPEEYDQAVWVNACGTAFCVAGHALRLEGHAIELRREEMDGVFPRDNTYLDGELVNIHDAARDALGLTNEEAYLLFDENNSRYAVQYTATDIAARAGERL